MLKLKANSVRSNNCYGTLRQKSTLSPFWHSQLLPQKCFTWTASRSSQARSLAGFFCSWQTWCSSPLTAPPGSPYPTCWRTGPSSPPCRVPPPSARWHRASVCWRTPCQQSPHQDQNGRPQQDRSLSFQVHFQNAKLTKWKTSLQCFLSRLVSPSYFVHLTSPGHHIGLQQIS